MCLASHVVKRCRFLTQELWMRWWELILEYYHIIKPLCAIIRWGPWHYMVPIWKYCTWPVICGLCLAFYVCLSFRATSFDWCEADVHYWCIVSLCLYHVIYKRTEGWQRYSPDFNAHTKDQTSFLPLYIKWDLWVRMHLHLLSSALKLYLRTIFRCIHITVESRY